MSVIPTPWQYFIDVMADGRIREAHAEGHPGKLKLTLAYYADLKENEVVFGIPEYHRNRVKPSASYWTVGYICRPRNYRRNDVTFRQLPIEGMLKNKADIASANFDRIRKTGFYFDRITGQYHLLIEKDTNLWEALKLTGYRYDPDYYKFERYDEYHYGLQADGHINVDYPFVGGKIYVTYLRATPLPEDIETPAVVIQEAKVADNPGVNELTSQIRDESGPAVEADTVVEPNLMKEPIVDDAPVVHEAPATTDAAVVEEEEGVSEETTATPDQLSRKAKRR